MLLPLVLLATGCGRLAVAEAPTAQVVAVEAAGEEVATRRVTGVREGAVRNGESRRDVVAGMDLVRPHGEVARRVVAGGRLAWANVSHIVREDGVATFGDACEFTELDRDGEGNWQYTPGSFSEPTGRAKVNGTGTWEDDWFWDPVGRLTNVYSQCGLDQAGNPVTSSSYRRYDGAGRLIGIDEWSGGAVSTSSYAYDVDDQLVKEVHEPAGREVYRFQGWRHDTATGETVAKLLPMVSARNSELRWTFTEPDGHAPDSHIPDQGPGRDMGGHQSSHEPHEPGQRNVGAQEEHSRVAKGQGGRGPRGGGGCP